jgi:hypothetical protein
MEKIGAVVSWRKCDLEMDLQRVDFLDLEQKTNAEQRVIHNLWKRFWLRKKSDWTEN